MAISFGLHCVTNLRCRRAIYSKVSEDMAVSHNSLLVFYSEKPFKVTLKYKDEPFFGSQSVKFVLTVVCTVLFVFPVY